MYNDGLSNYLWACKNGVQYFVKPLLFMKIMSLFSNTFEPDCTVDPL